MHTVGKKKDLKSIISGSILRNYRKASRRSKEINQIENRKSTEETNETK